MICYSDKMNFTVCFSGKKRAAEKNAHLFELLFFY